MEASRYRRHCLLYSVITWVLTWALQIYMIRQNTVHDVVLIGAMMWIPGVVSLLYRQFAGLGFRNIGWRISSAGYFGMALLIPLALAFLTNILGHALQMVSFQLFHWEKFSSQFWMFVFSFAACLFGAMGEEIGWRGFLLPFLVKGKVRRPLLVSSVVWALWHIPLVTAAGFYSLPEPLLVGLSYGISIVGLGIILGSFRVRSGSIWVTTLFHASHNFFFQIFVPTLFFVREGAHTKWWEVIGADGGVLVGILYLMMVLLLQSEFVKRQLTAHKLDMTPEV